MDLIPTVYSPVFAPPAVCREFGERPQWLIHLTPQNAALVAALELQLGAGESEAIALAHELGHVLIVDDRRARIAAERVSVRCTGTIGVLVLARQAGHVTLLAPVIADLGAQGFFVGDAVEREALRQVGELPAV